MIDKIDALIKNLENNNFKVTYLEKKEELIPYLRSQMLPSSTVAVGGSVSLFETGVIDLLRSGKYNFLDRYAEGADVDKIFHDSFFANYYFASANAITLSGEIYNVDGNANRVAAISFGPEHVYLIVSTNKIVADLREAALRVKKVVAPLNAKRLKLNTPCAKLGHCIQDTIDEDTLMCNGQRYCQNTICANVQILSRQRNKDRIEVILINEKFGY